MSRSDYVQKTDSYHATSISQLQETNDSTNKGRYGTCQLHHFAAGHLMNLTLNRAWYTPGPHSIIKSHQD